MKIKLSIVIIVSLFTHIQASAKFFSCQFTEPFLLLYISTKHKIVTSIPLISATESYPTRLTVNKVTETKNVIFLDQTISIHKNVIGSNGMSDLNYPYEAIYISPNGNKLFGGCSSEDIDSTKALVNRVPSMDPFGLTMVNYWPGEMTSLMGYKTSADVTLTPEQTFVSINESPKVNDTKECKIKKNKVFMPALSKKGESYSSLNKVRKYKARKNEKLSDISNVSIKTDDIVYELAPLSEGFCITEISGKLFNMICPANNALLFDRVDEKNQKISAEIPFEEAENFVFTQCQDGHWTWISETTFQADPKIFETIEHPLIKK